MFFIEFFTGDIRESFPKPTLKNKIEERKRSNINLFFILFIKIKKNEIKVIKG